MTPVTAIPSENVSRVSRVELPPPQRQDDVISWLLSEPNRILPALDGAHDGDYEVRRINVRNGDHKEYWGDIRGSQSQLTTDGSSQTSMELTRPERLTGSSAASPTASVDRLRRSRIELPTAWFEGV